jgi:hypothetical protein
MIYEKKINLYTPIMLYDNSAFTGSIICIN